jgi:hypothetical protein
VDGVLHRAGLAVAEVPQPARDGLLALNGWSVNMTVRGAVPEVTSEVTAAVSVVGADTTT